MAAWDLHVFTHYKLGRPLGMIEIVADTIINQPDLAPPTTDADFANAQNAVVVERQAVTAILDSIWRNADRDFLSTPFHLAWTSALGFAGVRPTAKVTAKNLSTQEECSAWTADIP